MSERWNDVNARRLDDEVERLGVVLEGTAELTIGPVAVGPRA